MVVKDIKIPAQDYSSTQTTIVSQETWDKMLVRGEGILSEGALRQQALSNTSLLNDTVEGLKDISKGKFTKFTRRKK